MTDYGRGPGSEPWHPEDPLYGDPGWGAQQPAGGHAPYGGQPQQQYPQQHAQPQQQYGGGQDPYQQQYAPQQQPQQYGQPGAQQQHPGQQAYGGQQYADPQQQPQHHQHPHQQQQHPHQVQHPQQYDQQQHVQHPHQAQQHLQQQQPQHLQQQQPQQPQYNDPQYNGGWDTGQQASMPYASNPAVPYDGAHGVGYGEGQDDYGTTDAYPPPRPPAQRKAEPEPAEEWEDDQEKESHPFFTGEDDGDDEGQDGGRRGNGGRERRTKKKSHNGVACLFLSVVLVGGVGGAGYVAYQFYQSKFGAPEDFVGTGTSSVQVEIPQGAGGYEIASILVKGGVVKSAGAFVAAQRQNPQGNSIQAGVYTLKKGMSAAQAVKLMLSPASHNDLIIPEGKRNVWVYEQMDKRLGLKKGTTAAVAKAQAKNLGLPDWARGSKDIKDPLEGFLFPASYPVAKGTKPETILKKMVARANSEYSKVDLADEADKLGLTSPLQVITVASLVQAEGKYKHDFDKVSRVVYNRLEPDNTETVGRLEFDSTVNYIKSQSKLDLGAVDDLRRIKDPYNTYSIKGLPPGPIGNPGAEALQSALNPTPGPWYYFVSVTEDKTLFAETNEEHERNRNEYLKESQKESPKR